MKPLYFVIGKSGTGKDSIVDALCEMLNRTKVKSYTTRPPRTKTEDTHKFVSEELFNKLDIVAKTKFNNYLYGATQEQIDNADFYIIDKAGIVYFKRHNRTPRKCITVYITAPEHIRRHRITERENAEVAEQRLKNDRHVFHNSTDNSKYNYIVPNIGELQTAINIFKHIIEEVENER